VFIGCGQCDGSDQPPASSVASAAVSASPAADPDPALCAKASECCRKVYGARKTPIERCEELAGKGRQYCAFALGLSRKLGEEVGVKCD
jgi:hypothetical protein